MFRHGSQRQKSDDQGCNANTSACDAEEDGLDLRACILFGSSDAARWLGAARAQTLGITADWRGGSQVWFALGRTTRGTSKYMHLCVIEGSDGGGRNRGDKASRAGRAARLDVLTGGAQKEHHVSTDQHLDHPEANHDRIVL